MTDTSRHVFETVRRPAPRYKLHGNAASMPSYKVALMLALCGENYDWNEVDIFAPEFRRGERSAAFLEVSRFGQIPALRDSGTGYTLVQSNVILRYIAEETRRFLPSSRLHDLRAQEWLSFEAGRLFEGFAGTRFLSKFGNGDPAVIEHYRKHANRQLHLLNTALENANWLVGGIPTIADISIFSLTSYAPEIDVDLTENFPAIASWHERMRMLPGYQGPETLLR